MAEYLVQSESLVAVAKAIREKGETSANLSFPEGFVSAITAIKTNSFPSGVSALDSGTYTPAQDVSSGVSLNHNLGITPNFVMYVADVDNVISSSFGNYAVSAIAMLKNHATNYYEYAGFSMGNYCQGGSFITSGSSAYEEIGYAGSSWFNITFNNAPLKKGVTYRWIVGIIDEI